jgi:hypothetical protein
MKSIRVVVPALLFFAVLAAGVALVRADIMSGNTQGPACITCHQSPAGAFHKTKNRRERK